MSSQFMNFLDDMDLILPSQQNGGGGASSSGPGSSGGGVGDANSNAIMSTLIMPTNSHHAVFAAGPVFIPSNHLFNSNPSLPTFKYYEHQHQQTAHLNDTCSSQGGAELLDPYLSQSMDPLILMESSESSQAPSPPPPPPTLLPMDASPVANAAAVDDEGMFQGPLPSISTLSIRNTAVEFARFGGAGQQQDIIGQELQKTADSLAHYSTRSLGTRPDPSLTMSDQFQMLVGQPLAQTPPQPQPYASLASIQQPLRPGQSQPPAPLLTQQSMPILLHPVASMLPSSDYDAGRAGLTSKPVNHNTSTSSAVISPSISSVSSCSSFSSYSAVSTSSSSGSATRPTALSARPELLHRQPRPHAQQTPFAHRSSLPLPLFSSSSSPSSSSSRSDETRGVNRPNSIQQYDSSSLFGRLDFSADLADSNLNSQYRQTNISSRQADPNHHQQQQTQQSNEDEFAMDDFNLPTPTTDDKSLVSHSSLSTPPPVFPSTSSSSKSQDPFDDATPSSSSSRLNLPLLDQLNLSSSSNTNSYNISNNFLNSSYNNSPANFITNAPGQLGFVSRSNSQPDLTLNMESRLQPQPNSSLADSPYPANGYYYYHANQSMMNKSKSAISRHPSLTCKTSIGSEFDSDDFLNNFNLFDYLNTAGSQLSGNHHHNQFSNSSNYWTINGNYSRANAGAAAEESPAMNKDNVQAGNSAAEAKSSGVFTGPGFDAVSSGTALESRTLASKTADEDNIFLGTDAISDFLNNCGTFSGLLDNLLDIEDYMSLVTFESSAGQSSQPVKQTQCDLALPSTSSSSSSGPSANGMILSYLTNYADDDSRVGCSSERSDRKGIAGSSHHHHHQADEAGNFERITRSAPPSPTPQRKKQRPTNNLPWQKAWSKMDDEEQSKIIEFLTKVINEEMGFREQLEIIRILNADVKLKPSDTQFIIDLKLIDDEKFRRVKEVIKLYGLSLSEKPLKDNSSDCSANSCPQNYQLLKRELRLKRAQQRLKLKQKKDHRQIVKESKSGLFNKTEVVPLSQALPEEDIDIDVLS